MANTFSKLYDSRSLNRLDLLMILAVCFILSLAPHARPQTQMPDEYQIKAAFLYNFAKFIEWPNDSSMQRNEPFIIGLFGEDPFNAILSKKIRGRTIQGHSIMVQRFYKVKEIRACQVLFINSSEKKRFKEILRHINRSPILTVADVDDFSAIGGMINFIIVKNKIRFEINPQAAEKNGLKISSRLLKLAKIVHSK